MVVILTAMDSRPIRHFLAAYDAGTFAAAADRLNLSQQAISKSILRLEEELGVRLFERDGRRVRPTRAAELLLPHARTIAAETDRFRADLVDMLGGRKGRLRVGVGPSAAADIVARAVRSMAAEQPVISLQILEGVQEKMSEQLTLGALDLYVALRQVDRADPLIREEELGSIDYILVAGASHPLAGRRRVPLAELTTARWLAGANLGAVEGVIEESFRSAGVPLFRAEIETTSVLFTLAMLDGGAHLAILPEMLVARNLASGRLVRIDVDAPAWSRPLIVGTRIRAPKPAQVAAFVAKLREQMAVQ
ncbi:MAG: LysR family transcriptional regulator [Sphingomonadales bacterium]|nr:MAG: LysR family transcriptional regulator [Sphingomonadales bacterium]